MWFNSGGNRLSKVILKSREETLDKFVIPLMTIERLEKLEPEKKLVVVWCKDCRYVEFLFLSCSVRTRMIDPPVTF